MLVFNIMGRAAWACDALSRWCCALLLLTMTSIMVLEVALRYFFNAPLMWAESAVKVFLIALCFLGAGMALMRRGHINITVLRDRLPARMRNWFRFVFDAVALAFFVFLTVYGYKTALEIPGRYWEFGNIPMKWIYMVVPVSNFIISIEALYLALGDIMELMKRAPFESPTSTRQGRSDSESPCIFKK